MSFIFKKQYWYSLVAAANLFSFSAAYATPQQENRYAPMVKEMVALIKEAAAKEISPRWKKVHPEEKSGHRFKDLVTAADKEASNYILSKGRPTVPGSYSEEHKFADRFNHSLLWQIDPVDGTQEFCEGYQEGYTTLAALLQEQSKGIYHPLACIIYQPALYILWYTTGNNQVIWEKRGIRQTLPTYSPPTQILVYQRKVDHIGGIQEFLPLLSDHFELPARTVEGGGAGAAVIDLLEERINLLIFNNNTTKDWDVGMAVPIIKALGGFVCDLDGNELTFNGPDEAGLGEPYNLRGYVISIVFKKEDVIPLLKKLTFDDRLKVNKA